MNDFGRYFVNFLSNRNISTGELHIFTQDHIGRLKEVEKSGEHAGALQALLEKTIPLFDAYVQAAAQYLSAKSGREGATMKKADTFLAFRKEVSRKEGLVRDRFGRPSKEYESFFPRGLTQYHRATLENADILMGHMIVISTKHAARVGAEMAEEFTALRDAFLAARDAQLLAIGGVALASRQQKEARRALELQLLRNLLTIAAMFVGQPEMGNAFFTPSLLRDRKKRKKKADASTDAAAPETAAPAPAG